MESYRAQPDESESVEQGPSYRARRRKKEKKRWQKASGYKASHARQNVSRERGVTGEQGDQKLNIGLLQEEHNSK